MTGAAIPLKKKALLYVFNALLVLLALFLAYRILSPSYERKENFSINKLGSFHTQLAAERVGAKLSNLREELRENGLRLVDPARGPVTLDSTRWLWVRIQDRDWRAPQYLEPLPNANIDVDSWAVRAQKNSFVISERIPILKDGVQDFVLLEGGLRPVVFQDLQTDASFGIWVFDLKAYEKGGIGAAKIYEKGSSSGLLAKEEVKLLTSDLLMQLFQKQEPLPLNANYPWVVNFRKTSGPTQLGVLGYWLPEAAPMDLSSVWLSLALALLVLSGLASFFILHHYQNYLKSYEEDLVLLHSAPKQKSESTPVTIKIGNSESNRLQASMFNKLFDWIHMFTQKAKSPLNDLKDRNQAALEILNQPQYSESKELRNILLGSTTNFDKLYSFFGRFDSYFGSSEGKIEVFDPEMFFLELQRSEEDFPAVDSFFDPDLWRIRASKQELGYLLIAYVKYLHQLALPENKLSVSTRFIAAELDEASAVEVIRSEYFKAPFTRFLVHLSTQNPVGRSEILEIFDLTKVKDPAQMDLALTQRVVARLGGRLKVKSNFEDGNMIILDIPAHEERKAEDKINAKQLRDVKNERFFKTSAAYVAPPHLADPEPEVEDAAKTVLSASEVHSSTLVNREASLPSAEKSEPPLSVTKIEKVNSFAEEIKDERSRVRSRFRIRKPGEKE